MLGHPDAAYDLPLEVQTRLLGWVVARSTMTTHKPVSQKAGNTDLSFGNFGGVANGLCLSNTPDLNRGLYPHYAWQ